MLLSVVLVVSRHQAWIRPCLRSLLDQAPPEVEVVVVDDASPDHTPRIITEAVGDDPRVRRHRYDVPVGAGAARQIGLELATGTYVWVFDATDLLLPAAWPRLLAALQGRPDVLLLPDLVRDVYDVALGPPAAPGRRPVLRDRIVLRGLIRPLAGRPGGAFSEIPLATAVLSRAATVADLDEPVHVHRELPARVTRQWSTEDPFDVFAAYDAAFDELSAANAPSGHRARLAAAMLVQARSLLDTVEPARKAEYLGLLARSVSARRADIPTPRGRFARAELAAIESNRYLVFHALAQQRFRLRSARRGVRKIPRNRRMLRSRWLQALYALHRRRPLQPEVAVFSAYWGSAYSCNPRAIYERAAEQAPWIRGIWVVKPGSEGVLPASVPYVVEGSRDYYRVMARATYFVNNANFGNDVVKRPGQVHLQTHHGTPLKTMGLDLVHARHSSMGLNFRRLMKRVERWDYSISANEFTTEIWERVYPSGTYQSLETGYPRNDVFHTATSEDRERIRAGLGIGRGQTAVLYTPTHREYTKEYVALLDVDALAEALGPDHVVLMRAHYFYSNAGQPASGRVRDVAAHPSIEELAIASDVLVTDYSSLMFDYAVLDRPIVVYAPDWETYRTERGTYFDLMAEPPGAVATTQDQLTEVLTSGVAGNDENAALRAAFRARFCALEDGHAAERVVRTIWPAPAAPGHPVRSPTLAAPANQPAGAVGRAHQVGTPDRRYSPQ